MRKISLKNNKKHSYLIYIGIAFILLGILVRGMEDALLQPPYHQALIVGIFIFSVLLLSAVLTGVVAYRLNRSVVLWVIVTILFAPISLIVLGNLKMSVHHKLQKTFDEYASEYLGNKTRLISEVSEGTIDYETYERQLAELLSRLDSALNSKKREVEELYGSEFD